MTANQMRDEFKSLIDGSELRGHDFDDRDIEIYLNNAMDDEVTDMFMPDKNPRGVGYSSDVYRQLQLTGLVAKRKAYKKSNGEFLVGTEDNGALPKPHEDTGTIEYGVFVDVPNECLFPILMRADIQGECLRKNIRVMMIDEAYYQEHIDNGQRQPYKSLVWCLEYGNYTYDEGSNISNKGMDGNSSNGGDIEISSSTNRVHLLIPGKDYEIDAYNLRYVKRPNRIVIDIEMPVNQKNCELNEAIHKNIVERAVKIGIGAILPKESKYNLAQQESMNNA